VDAATYRRAQHDTLNFETCGDERSSPDEASSTEMGQLLYFPARVAERAVVSNQRRENNMTNEPDAASETSESATTRQRGSYHERTETFSPAGPVRVDIYTKCGDAGFAPSRVTNSR
jgi:hypothetical protein